MNIQQTCLEVQLQVTSSLSLHFSLKKSLFEIGKDFFNRKKKVKKQSYVEQFLEMWNFNAPQKTCHPSKATFRGQGYFLMASLCLQAHCIRVPKENTPIQN